MTNAKTTPPEAALVAIAPIPGGKPDDRAAQNILIGPPMRNLALRRSMLAEHRARAALGGLQLRHDMIDAAPAT